MISMRIVDEFIQFTYRYIEVGELAVRNHLTIIVFLRNTRMLVTKRDQRINMTYLVKRK